MAKRKNIGGTLVVSASLSREFWDLANENGIGWSEALRVGLSIMFADIGVKDYDNNLNLHRKMKKYQEKTVELMAELEQFKTKINEKQQFEVKNE